MAGNKIYRRKYKRKATMKKKFFLKKLKIQMKNVKLILQNIIQYKEK